MLYAQIAEFHGGPLNGQAQAIRTDARVWFVPGAVVGVVSRAADPADAVRVRIGRYQFVGYGPDGSIFEWHGWDDEQTHLSAVLPEVRAQQLRMEQYFVIRGGGGGGGGSGRRGVAGTGDVIYDEWWPDAMRWTPDVAEDEIAEWQKILHPGSVT